MPKLAVPSTVAEMQEIINTPVRVAEWVQAGQFSEVIDAYAEATRPSLADQVTDQLKAFFDGESVIENKVDAALNKVLSERGGGNIARLPLGEPAGHTSASMAASYNPLAPGVPMDEIGYQNLGDFARVVFNKGRSNDPRREKAVEVMNAYSSYDPSAGGFLIPETMRSEIMELALPQEIVRPRASIMVGTGAMVLPYVDQPTHVGSVFGGMTFSWTPESGTVTPTEAKFGRTKYEPNKLMGLARIPNELWADAAALSSWLMNALPRGIAFFEDLAFMTGTGAGQPLGVTNSPAKITITKETNQAASTIVVENILKMYARCLPQSLGSAVWLANPTCFPQLMGLSIAVGTGGAPVMLVDLHGSPNLTMLGRPLILTEKVPALGAAGDIGLYDFGFYTIQDRQAASVESSEHSRFANDETELRTILRVDGRPWIQSALQPVNGDSLSPFVVLGARA